MSDFLGTLEENTRGFAKKEEAEKEALRAAREAAAHRRGEPRKFLIVYTSDGAFIAERLKTQMVPWIRQINGDLSMMKLPHQDLDAAITSATRPFVILILTPNFLGEEGGFNFYQHYPDARIIPVRGTPCDLSSTVHRSRVTLPYCHEWEDKSLSQLRSADCEAALVSIVKEIRRQFEEGEL